MKQNTHHKKKVEVQLYVILTQSLAIDMPPERILQLFVANQNLQRNW